MRMGFARCLVLVMLAAPTANAQDMFGDPDEGERVARETCVTCHSVDPGEIHRVLSPVLSFQEIATDPSTTEMSLRVFLRSPHLKMPNFILTERETDDVVAYILSLKQ